MTAEEVRLLGLIGLRALAEYDPPEYRRVADMSKRQLDLRIKSLLEEVDSTECRELYGDLSDIVDSLESPLEMSYLLRQIHLSSMNRAQYYSLQISRKEKAGSYEESVKSKSRPVLGSAAQDPISEGDELVRLSTMLMLKELRDYAYDFHRQVGPVQVDCVLEPKSQDLPFIFVEAKSAASSGRHFESELAELRQALDIFGGNVLGVIIAEALPENDEQVTTDENIQLLRFDVRRNQFVGQDFRRLVTKLENRGQNPHEASGRQGVNPAQG